MKQRLGIAQAILNRPKLLICDEPTSALDPVGRKEILDILFSLKDRTTVLFSTHVLSDVERICTDVAFLDNGVVNIKGKLSEIKGKFGREEYLLQTQNPTDVELLIRTFENMKTIGENQLIFKDGEPSVHDVMRFVSDRRIPILKIEKAEPTLETLFMEAVEK